MRQIDLKHFVLSDGRIVRSKDGIEIPMEEPLFLFRGHDTLAVPTLERYRQICGESGCSKDQLEQVDEMIAKFKAYSMDFPTEMKRPGD